MNCSAKNGRILIRHIKSCCSTDFSCGNSSFKLQKGGVIHNGEKEKT